MVVVVSVIVVVSINTVVVRRNEVVVLVCVVVSIGAVVVVAAGVLVGPNVVVTLCNGDSVVVVFVVLVELESPSPVVLLALLPSCAYVDVINSRININFIVLLNASFEHSHMLSGVGIITLKYPTQYGILSPTMFPRRFGYKPVKTIT